MKFEKIYNLRKNIYYLLYFIALSLISLNKIKCDLILRSQKDLQSQFAGKKIRKNN